MFSHRMGRLVAIIFSAGLLGGCSAKILQHDRADEVLRVDEYEQKMDVKEAPEPPAPNVKPIPETTKPTPAPGKASMPGKGAKAGGKISAAETSAPKPKGPRQPGLEDSVGFDGRRPLADPFRVGEKAVFDVSYFNMTAGEIEMEVKPFVTVNGKKAYHFEVSGRSNSFFARIYTVDDKAVTYLDYNELIPLNLQISIKESKQLAEARTYFDWKNLRASYWQKKITKDKGERSKKIDWEIQPYSQNVITAPYYLRVFQLEPGKKLAFRVADEGKNIVFKGEVLRREKLNTALGELNTVVVKPEVTVDGVFKPVGDILLWLTDDDRKHLVRLESKIKIGTVVAKIKSLDKGRE